MQKSKFKIVLLQLYSWGFSLLSIFDTLREVYLPMKWRILSIFFIVFVFLVPHPTFATGPEMCSGGTGIATAIGCVDISSGNFVKNFLTIGIGMAGGIAFLLILFGGLQIMTSAGNPEKLNEGKELVSSAITGLLLIIFSVFILRLISVDILGIPGFS